MPPLSLAKVRIWLSAWRKSILSPRGPIMMRIGLQQADGVDGHAGVLNRGAGLVVGQFAEGVDAGGDQQNRLAAFDILHALRGVDQGVVQVRLRENPGMRRRCMAS